MEPRLLLSADALGIDAGVLSQNQQEHKPLELTTAADWSFAAATLVAGQDEVTTDHSDQNREDIDSAPVSASNESGELRTEILFLDSAVEDGSALLDDILINDDRNITQIYLLDAGQDGIEQIANILDQYSDVDAVHIISHGNEGEIHLGNSTLSDASLPDYQQTLSGWADSLSGSADILIYGCDIAVDAAGQSLVDAIAKLTGADVAASDDLTGSSQSGGDWELEYVAGIVESDAFAESDIQGWQGTLGEILSDGKGSTNAIAMDANGNYVIVYSTLNQDGDAGGIYAQLYDSAGVAQDGEILVNQYTTGDQIWASVGMSDTGEFVVTWTSDNQDGDGLGIYARQFNADGTAADDEFLVNTVTTGDQTNSSIDVDAAGNFIIVWQGNGPADSDGVFFRRFNADGTDMDANEVIAHADTGAEFDPVVAWQSGGKFVVAWEEDSNKIYFQRFDNTGSMLGSRTQIDSIISTSAGLSVDTNAAGAFVFAYKEEAIADAIYVRGFNEDGSELFTNGNHILDIWASVGDADSLNPSIAIDDNGEVIVAYQTTASGGDIHLQRINPDGSQTASAVTVVTDTDDQNMPVIAINDEDVNDYVLAWNDITNSVTTTLTSTTSSLTPIQDTYINSDSTGTNYGDQQTFNLDEAGGSDQGNGRPLLQFDLSSIPTGATITSATLQLETASGPGATVIEVFEVTQAWDEGTGSGDGATWINSQTGTPWGTAGGAINPSSIASLDVSNGGTHNWDITSLVEGWFLGSITNYGLMLGSADTGTNVYSYASRESLTPPELIITYTVNNNPPSITSTEVTSATEDTPYSYIFTASDTDTGDTLTLSAPTLPGWMSFNPGTGVLSGTPTNAEVGDHNVVMRVNDGTVDVDQSFTITVTNTNDASTATNLTTTSNYTEGAATVPITDIVVSDDDIGENITATLTLNETSTGSLSTNDGSSYNGISGIWQISGSVSAVNTALANLVFTPNVDNDTDSSISVWIDDGNEDGGGALTGFITLDVIPANDAPTITSTEVTTATEDTPYTYTFTVNDVDTSDTLTLSAPTLPGWMSFNPATGILSGTPTNAEVGDHNVVLRVNDGTVDVDQVFTLTVSNANDAPTITSTEVTTATEDTPYSYTFTATDADVGDTLTLSAPTLPGWMSFDPGTGILSGTPTNAQVGDHSVVLRVNDGTVDVDQVFTLTVSNANDAPTITSTEVTTATEDTPYTYTFTVNDVDTGDTLTLSAPTLPGWMSFNPATGILSGTPTNAEVGDHNVVLRVNDGTVDDDQNFTVTVTPINNNNPVADDESFTVIEGGTATEINLDSGISLLDGDTDLDLPNDTLIVNTTHVSGPLHGALTLNSDGTFSYTHDGSENFIDSFSYELLDADGGVSDTGTVTITITPINDNEEVLAVNTGTTVDENSSGNVITSAMLESTDIDNPPEQLVYTLTSVPNDGSLYLNNITLMVADTFTQNDIDNGWVSYDHNGTENSTDSFGFSIDDGNAAITSSSFSININTINDAPVINSNYLALNPGDSIIVDSSMLSATDADHEDTSLIFTVSNVEGGQFELINAPGVAIASFTQEQINIASVVFVDDGDTEAPAYDVVVTDGQVSSTPTQAAINLVIPAQTAESSTVTIPSLVDTSETDFVSTIESEITDNKTNEDLAEAVTDEEAIENMVLVNQDSDATVAIDNSEEMTATVPDFNNKFSTSNSTQDLLTKFLFKPLAQTAAAVLPLPSAYELDALTTQIRAVLVSDDFTHSLNQMREEISTATVLHQNIIATSVAATTGLSVGYIAWLVRGGVLLSTALSSLPAWQFIDPLPVLSHNTGKEDDDEDDSLEEIIKEESQRTDKRNDEQTDSTQTVETKPEERL